MKFFLAAVAAAIATATSVDAAACSTSVLSGLLANPDLEPCGQAAGYDFTSGKKPTEAQALKFCGVESCERMVKTTLSTVTTDCTIPLGDKINLLADLVLYAKNLCDSQAGPSPSPSPSSNPPSSPSSSPPSSPSVTPSPPAAC